MKITIPAVAVLIFILSLPLMAWGDSVEVGQEAPEFMVYSPEDAALTLNDLIGKTVIIFYENKDLAPKTNPLKEKVGRVIAKYPNRLILINILDCTPANWLTKPFWKSKMSESGREYGLTLWADWSGDMLRDYGLKKDASNVVIIDSSGVIRFVQRGDVLKGFKAAEAKAVLAEYARMD